MFAKTVIDSDAFLDMPMSAQALYFHLAMRADDDGFLNNPKKVQRMIGASEDDLRILLAKRFILAFESGVIVIKHWRVHNYLRSDRYNPTIYTEEKAKLTVKPNGAYTECIQEVSKADTNGIPDGIPDGYRLDTQVSIGKDSIGKVSIGKDNTRRFTPPSVGEVEAYCKERGNSVDPEAFVDFYASKGWKVGKNPMKDWQAAVRTWEKTDNRGPKDKQTSEASKAVDSSDLLRILNNL